MTTLTHKFVKNVPEVIEDGVVYVSVEYATAIHKCCCGCGKEVVTPLSPTDWQLCFDGKTISLYPSIGNWSFPCQSHYWITNNEIRWAPKWTKEQIKRGRKMEEVARQNYFNKKEKLPRSIFNFFKKRK